MRGQSRDRYWEGTSSLYLRSCFRRGGVVTILLKLVMLIVELLYITSLYVAIANVTSINLSVFWGVCSVSTCVSVISRIILIKA